ncbi:DNA-binding response regulator [Alloscardovia omnicolens]|uniref:response regulator transcription factor n=1 Tax=Alloscardovia omnicolens TaxID=419015 RepID=UPI003A63221F
MTVRVLIADDQAMVLEALATLLNLQEGIEVVCTCSSSNHVLTAVEQSNPDVCLLDIEMPGIDGLSLVEILGRAHPQIPCIMVTTFGRPGYVQRSMAAGAKGFLVKSASAQSLAESIHSVMDGNIVIDSQLAVAAMTIGASPLTNRERDVMRLVRAGKHDADIAKELHMSSGTVRNHVSSVLAKTQTSSRIEAALLVEESGWL